MATYIYVLRDLSLMEDIENEQVDRYMLTTQMISYVEASTETAVREYFMKHICHYYLHILFRTYRSIHTSVVYQNDVRKYSFITQQTQEDNNLDSMLLENADAASNISPVPRVST